MTTPAPDADSTDSLVNLRDLAGLPTEGGVLTRQGVLYRGDAPYHGDAVPSVTPQWPPRVVVDLRDTAELCGTEHPLAERASVRRVALLEQARGHEDWLSLRDLYLYILRAVPEKLVKVFRIAVATEGPVLIHCAAGKDRTGVVVAMLLSAVGVRRDSIVADYLHTDRNMLHVLRRLGELPEELPPGVDVEAVRELNSTPVDAIEGVLEYFDGYPDGVVGWLEAHGVTADEVECWREKFVGAS